MLDVLKERLTGRVAAAAIAAVWLLFPLAASADEPRFHGLVLDDKHRLQVEEDKGWAILRVQFKDRAPGGPADDTVDPRHGGPVIRFEDEYVLIRMRSEVIAPAPPNYVSNPGNRYRITIIGETVAPDYAKLFEVDAADARDAIFSEINKLLAETHGVNRAALYIGTAVAMEVLNESGYLPANLPLTLLRSKVGQQRIQGQHFARGQQARIDRFADVKEGGGYARTFSKDPLIDVPTPEEIQGAAYKRGTPANTATPDANYATKRYSARRDLRPPDPRANAVRGLGDPRPEEQRFGAALTDRERGLAPIALSERDNMEILTGSTKSPLQLRAERKQRMPAIPGYAGNEQIRNR